MTILIVNNYSDEEDMIKAKKIEEILKAEGKSEVIMWHFSEIKIKEIPGDLEAIILSGSRAHLQDIDVHSEYTAEAELITEANIPILGICFGHQLIGKAFGAEIGSLPKFLEGPREVGVLEPDEILMSWNTGDTLRLQQSHKDFVENIPPQFICLAESDDCKVEAMKHETRPIYGVQAHIERATVDEPDGHQIIRNFLEHVVEKHVHAQA